MINKKRISKALVLTGLCTLLNQGIINNKVCAENIDGQNDIEKLLVTIKEGGSFNGDEASLKEMVNVIVAQKETIAPKNSTTPGAVEVTQDEKVSDTNKITPVRKEIAEPKESTTPGAVEVQTQDEKAPDTNKITPVPKESTTPGAIMAPEVEKIPVTITVGKALGRPSKTESQKKVKIPVSIDQETFKRKFTGYTFDIVYDSSKLENVAVDAYEGAAKATLGTPVDCGDSKMKVTVSWKGTLQEESYDGKKGVLFKVNFDIKSAFTSGETPVEITNGKFICAPGVETDNVVANNGKVLFGMYGDVNGDGRIDSMDMNLIKKQILKKSQKTKVSENKEARQMASDVNRDGKIDMEDLRELDNSIFGPKKQK